LRGRPEPFVIFLLGLAANLLMSLSRKWQKVVGGIAVGAVATTHPVAALLTGSLWMLYTSCQRTGKAWIREMCFSALLAAATMVVALAWYPYSFGEWIHGCLRHADRTIVGGWWKADAVLYWLIVPRPPLFGLICLVAIASSVVLYRRHGH